MSWTTRLDSPVGPLQLIAARDGALTHLLFVDERLPARAGSDLRTDPAPFADAIAHHRKLVATRRPR